MLRSWEALDCLAACLGRNNFRSGMETKHLYLIFRALADRVVATDRGDPPVGVLQAERRRGAGRKNVNHPAADRRLARLVDALVQNIADAIEIGFQGGEVERLAGLEHESGLGPGLLRRHALKQRVRRSDEDARLAACLD